MAGRQRAISKALVNKVRSGLVVAKKRTMIRQNDADVSGIERCTLLTHVGKIILNISELGHQPETFSGKL
jgi:hypothetical protein